MRTGAGVLVGVGASLVVTAGAIGAFAWVAPHEAAPTGFRAYLGAGLGPQVLDVTPADLAMGGPITSSSSQSGFLSSISGIPSQTVAATVLSAADSLGITDTAHVLRAMSSSVTDEGPISSNFYVALVDDAGLLKVAEMGSGGFTLWYSPPAVELPADVSVGSTWVGEGSVNDIARYEIEGSIEHGDTDDCIVALTTTALIIEGADPIETKLRSTWCLGKGSTKSVNVDTGRAVEVLTQIPVERLADVSPPSTPTYTAPTSLPFLSPTVLLKADVAGDVLVMTNSSSEDVVAITLTPPPVDPDDPDTAPPDLSVLRVAWMQHPGGEILGLTGDGQNSYLTSTTRAVMSFDRAGGLRWNSTTPDVSGGSPAVFGDLVVVATLDGSVFAFDRGTGAEKWSRTMSDAVVSDPVVSGSNVVVADIAGQISAFNASGETVWTAGAAAVTRPLTAFSDGSVLVGDDGGTLSLVAANGSEVWSSSLAGEIVGSARVTSGVVVVPTKAGLQGFDLVDGRERWRKEAWANAQVWTIGDGVAVTQGDRLASLSADGTLTPEQTVVEPDGDSVTDMQVVEIAGLFSVLTSGGGLLPWPGDA